MEKKNHKMKKKTMKKRNEIQVAGKERIREETEGERGEIISTF